MNATDLRIGNLVGFEKLDGTGLSIGQVTSLSVRWQNGIDGIGVCRWPIGKEEKRVFLGEVQTFGKAVGTPLTEDWLKKLGLKKSIGQFWELPVNHKKAKGLTQPLKFEGGILSGTVGVFWVEFEFVHSFQNWLFAMTGQELEIK